MDLKNNCITEPTKDECRGKCIRKQNLLVYDKSNPCVPKSNLPKTCYRISPLKPANIRKIKVCTGADLKRMCPPKLCACPSKKRRNTGLLASIGRLLGFGVKGALAGGLVYWTYEIGLWGKPEETEQLYLGLCKYAFAPSKEDLQKRLQEAHDRETSGCNKSCDFFKNRQIELAKEEAGNSLTISEEAILAQMKLCQKAPSIRENANCFKNCWNRFVVSSFDFVVDLPNKIMGPKKKKDESGEEVAEDECANKKKKPDEKP